MLEEVGEAALALLHFVAAAGADHRHVGDLAWGAGLDEVGLEPVLEFDQAVVEREDPFLLLRRGGSRQGQQECYSDHQFH